VRARTPLGALLAHRVSDIAPHLDEVNAVCLRVILPENRGPLFGVRLVGGNWREAGGERQHGEKSSH
jgi:hypothetical protein